MKMSDLQSKKIISIVNGKSIGNIIDCDINEHGGIDALIIEQNKGLFSLNKESDTRVFWNEIAKIGEDVILVRKDSVILISFFFLSLYLFFFLFYF